METSAKQYNLVSEEMSRHIEDAKISKVAHFKIADRYANFESHIQRVGVLSFAGIIVFWFISTQLYEVIEQFGGTVYPAWRTTTQIAIPIMFAVANVVATAFLYLNKFGERSRRHRHAAQRYHRFWRKCLNWRTEFPDDTRIDELVARTKSHRNELSEINDASPDIDEWAWKSVDTELAKGGTKYQVDKKSKV